jgi:hypothetical protein
MVRSTLLATGCVAALAFAALPTSASDESTVVPPTPHQDEVLRGAQQTDTPSGAVGDVECGMPASPHQKQVLSQDAGQGGQPKMGQELQPESNMPATPHQQQVLKGSQGEGEGDVAVPTEEGMPVSPHQQQVLKSNKAQQPGESC